MTAMEALRAADELLARHAPYEEVLAALERCEGLPGGESLLAGTAQRRLALTSIYARDLDEVEPALRLLLEVTPDAIARASSALGPCRGFPALAQRYLGTVLADLERDASAPRELVSRVRAVLGQS